MPSTATHSSAKQSSYTAIGPHELSGRVAARLDRRSHYSRSVVARRFALLFGLAAFITMSGPRTASSQGLGDSDWFARIGFAPAFVVANNPFESNEMLADEHVRWTPSTTLEIGRQTDGSQDWHLLYGMPSYGFGLSIASFGSDGEGGRPVDAYTFFSWPFARVNERTHVTSDIGMGASWNWDVYDTRTKSSRPVLGSNMNVRIDWGVYLRYLATPQASIYAGLDFTHRSNGGTRQPNVGINVFGPSVSLRYDLASERPVIRPRSPAPFHPSWEFVVGGAGGPKNVMGLGGSDAQHDFSAFDVGAGLQRQFYRYGKVAVGSDVTYDGAAGAQQDVVDQEPRLWRPGFRQRLSLGFYGGYEHVIGRFGAIVQFGCNVARGLDGSPRLYQRLGWRYHFSDRIFGTFNIRSTGGNKADFLEIGGGYRRSWS
jgi:hypothetical protein